MAGLGRAPKEVLQSPDKQRRRDAVTTRVATDGQVRGPELPGDEWPERTRQWWDNLRRSPMAQAWLDVDWDNLLDTALLHRKMWEGDTSVAAELRLRMSQFGTTPDSRLRLRIAVDAEVEQVSKPKPAMSAERKRRLLRAVGDGA